MAEHMSSPSPRLLPWGRLEQLTTGENPSLPDHYSLSSSRHCVGRVASRCDIQIQKPFISAVHCTIKMLGKDDSGNPIVEIEDQSRYGTWVNVQKVGVHNKARLKNGYVIHLTPPNSRAVVELCYKLVILPSGLTQANENLHALLSADEKSVATRTRKRTHEEIQGTQSPTRVVLPPPHQRPVKKVRRGTSREHTNEPVSEPHSDPPRSTGKRQRHSSVPAADSRLAQQQRGKLEEDYERLRKVAVQQLVQLNKSSEQLKNTEGERNVLRAENESYKEELRTLREEKAALKKSYEESLAKMKAQAATKVAEHSGCVQKELLNEMVPSLDFSLADSARS